MIFNDFDIWEQAFKEMKMNEAVSFVSRGKLITEASQVEMFNKINALLNCNGMECSHKWLYSLDPTELSESEATKVNNLWKLGCDRGMIECGEDEKDEEANEDEVVALEVAVQPDAPAPAPISVAPQSAYTILYSAMRNGEIKTGEAYSNSLNPRSAKADIIGQLERAGYTNIKILAIECGDPDEYGNKCNNTYCKQANMTPVAPQFDEIPDYAADDVNTITFEDDEKVEEADDKDSKENDSDNSEEADDTKEDSDSKEKEEDKKDSDKEDSDKEDSDKEDSDKEEDKKEEDAQEPDDKLKDDADEKAEKASDKLKEDKELDASEKSALKDSYKKAFKASMQKCKFIDKCFDDLTLDEKVKFFTELAKVWTKTDPSKFMSDKELAQLQTIVVKK